MNAAVQASLDVVILAAGKGTRMRSSLPKVLHRLAGRPLLEHVVRSAEALKPDSIHVVYGHGGEQVPEQLKHLAVRWIKQEPQLGTGHAVQQAMPGITGQTLLILYGDVPLTRIDTLRALLQAADKSGMALLTAELADPTGYGRIVRDAAGQVSAHCRAQGRFGGRTPPPRGQHRYSAGTGRTPEAVAGGSGQQ